MMNTHSHPRLKWVFLIGVLVFALSLTVTRRSKGEDSSAPLRSFAENLTLFEDNSTFSLAEIIPWSWDTATIVMPNANRKQLEKTMGLEIPEELFEAADEDGDEAEGFRIIFSNAGQVVFVLNSFSEDCTFVLQADPFWKLAKKDTDILQFTINDDVKFCKTSFTKDSVLWDVCSLTGNVKPYFISQK